MHSRRALACWMLALGVGLLSCSEPGSDTEFFFPTCVQAGEACEQAASCCSRSCEAGMCALAPRPACEPGVPPTVLWSGTGSVESIGTDARHIYALIDEWPADGASRYVLRVDKATWASKRIVDGPPSGGILTDGAFLYFGATRYPVDGGAAEALDVPEHVTGWLVAGDAYILSAPTQEGYDVWRLSLDDGEPELTYSNHDDRDRQVRAIGATADALLVLDDESLWRIPEGGEPEIVATPVALGYALGASDGIYWTEVLEPDDGERHARLRGYPDDPDLDLPNVITRPASIDSGRVAFASPIPAFGSSLVDRTTHESAAILEKYAAWPLTLDGTCVYFYDHGARGIMRAPP